MELISNIKKRFNRWYQQLWIKIGDKHKWGGYYTKNAMMNRPIPGPKDLKIIHERRKGQHNRLTGKKAREANSKFRKKKALQQPSKPLITKNNPKQDKKD